MTSPRRLARVAGAFYLGLAVCSGLAELYVRAGVKVPGDAAATGGTYTQALGADASGAVVLLLLELHGQGYVIAQVFFGLWLLPLGYLAYRSGYFPRALAVLLMVGCFGHLADMLVNLLFPGHGPALAVVVAAPAAVAEFWMIGYLLVRGVRAGATEAVPPRRAWHERGGRS